jgi:hypothetical protein
MVSGTGVGTPVPQASDRGEAAADEFVAPPNAVKMVESAVGEGATAASLFIPASALSPPDAEDDIGPSQRSADDVAGGAPSAAAPVAAESDPLSLSEGSSPEVRVDVVLDPNSNRVDGAAAAPLEDVHTNIGGRPENNPVGESAGVTDGASEGGPHDQQAPSSTGAGANEDVSVSAPSEETAVPPLAEEAQAPPSSPLRTVSSTAVSPSEAGRAGDSGYADEGEEGGRCESAMSFASDASADCARLAETFDRKDTRFSVYVPEQQDT